MVSEQRLKLIPKFFVSSYRPILKWVCWLHGMQVNMNGPDIGINGYMDKFGGEGFRAWKFKMAFLLRKDESWSLVNGDESMPWIPTIRIQKRKRLEIEDFYLTNELLQQTNECKTSK